MASENDPSKPDQDAPREPPAEQPRLELPDVPIFSVARPAPAFREPPPDPEEKTPPRPLPAAVLPAGPRRRPASKVAVTVWLGVGLLVAVLVALAVRTWRTPGAPTVTIRDQDVALQRASAADGADGGAIPAMDPAR